MQLAISLPILRYCAFKMAPLQRGGSNPCQPVYCSAGTSASSSWPQTLGNHYGTYICARGYYASNPSTYCSQNNGFATWQSNPCQPVYCSGGSTANATWPQTLAGTNGTYLCAAGYYASPSSTVNCTQNAGSASWGSNPCQPVYCSSGSSFNATWPQTLGNHSATFTCATGYFASNTSVYCAQNGGSASWGSHPCQPVFCPGGSVASSSWPQTLGGHYGTYICWPGYYATSNSLVYCTQNGASATWGTNPCQPFSSSDETVLLAFYTELTVKPAGTQQSPFVASRVLDAAMATLHSSLSLA